MNKSILHVFLVFSVLYSGTVMGTEEEFCEGRELNANYANPNGDCSTYIACDLAGKAKVMPCPTGLHYVEDDRPWGYCDYPHLAKCDDKISEPLPLSR
ncbi:chitin-binding domain-containing protein [Zobellella aerophila]|uniref:chitin-binding domain-containing protein n=1 Tax=Zobellella aerophila TaxID=870480 RepID=UPI003CD085EE